MVATGRSSRPRSPGPVDRGYTPQDWSAGDPSGAGLSDGEVGGGSGWVLDTEPSPSKNPKKKKRRPNTAGGEDKSAATATTMPPPFTIDTGGDFDAADQVERPPSPPPLASPPVRSRREKAEGNAGKAPPPEDELLLPGHVTMEQRRPSDSVAGDTSVPESVGEKADGEDIEGHLGDFTQIDADASVSRYYDVAAAEERKALKECEICGEKGHTKRDCSHLLCASCGATDEHTTRDCPVGISCFRCGQRGHRRNECTADLRRLPRHRDCGRCGSHNHAETTCPTYWRIYAYVDEEEWLDFRTRKAADLRHEQEQLGGSIGSPSRNSRKRPQRRHSDDMDTGSDSSDSDVGEPKRKQRSVRGHTPPRPDWDPAERWCYNCAARGTHWGDDCPRPRRGYNRNGEPSIFSEFISLAGPFASRLRPPRPEPAAPVADMYDVSVGPDASMHFFGGDGRPSGSRPTVEEEVDRLFARAPNASKRQVEKERARQREAQRRDRQEQQQRSSGKHIGNGHESLGSHTIANGTKGRMNGRTGTERGTGTTTTTTTTTSGTSFNHRAQQRQQRGAAAPSAESDFDVDSILTISSDGDDPDYSTSKKKTSKKAAKKKRRDQDAQSLAENANASVEQKGKRGKRGSKTKESPHDGNEALLMPTDSSGVPLAARLDGKPSLDRRREQSMRDKAKHAQSLQDRERYRQLNGIARPGEPAFGRFAQSPDFSGDDGHMDDARDVSRGASDVSNATSAGMKGRSKAKKAAAKKSKSSGHANGPKMSKAKSGPDGKAKGQTRGKQAKAEKAKASPSSQKPYSTVRKAIAAGKVKAKNGAGAKNKPMFKGSYD
ncbi:unnamed protein product [Parajaminaea phylloscopi]